MEGIPTRIMVMTLNDDKVVKGPDPVYRFENLMAALWENVAAKRSILEGDPELPSSPPPPPDELVKRDEGLLFCVTGLNTVASVTPCRGETKNALHL
jgi:hypothetical protein